MRKDIYADRDKDAEADKANGNNANQDPLIKMDRGVGLLG